MLPKHHRHKEKSLSISPSISDHEASNFSLSQKKSEFSNKKLTMKGYYVVEKILAKKIDKDGVKYKIKWQNYPKNQCTWEPIANLLDPVTRETSGVPQMIEDFEKKLKKTPKPKPLKTELSTETPLEKPKRHVLVAKKSSSNSQNSSFLEAPRPKQTGLRTKKIPKLAHTLEKSSKISLISLDSDEESAPVLRKKPSSKRTRELSRESSPSFSENVVSFKEKHKKICKLAGNREENVKVKGNFFHGDRAKVIRSAKLQDDEIICQIEWFPRENGVTPENSSFTNTIIKEFDPLLLVNYYEKGIVKLKKFENSQKIEKIANAEKNNDNLNKNQDFEQDFKNTSLFIEDKENLIKNKEILDKSKENSLSEMSVHENTEEKPQKIKLDELLSNISAKNN